MKIIKRLLRPIVFRLIRLPVRLMLRFYLFFWKEGEADHWKDPERAHLHAKLIWELRQILKKLK